jgi:acyl-CoA synthetase (AMP-forming)/AMP-acid ligase II
MSERLAARELPAMIWPLRELPRTATGKIRRSVLVELARRGRRSP